MKWQILTNLGSKIQMHFEFFTAKNSQFWHKNKKLTILEPFKNLYFLDQKWTFDTLCSSRAFLAMLDCAGGRFVRFSGFGFLPLYSFSENLACGYANWSIYPTFHGRKAYRRNKISPLWLLFPFSWVLGSLQSSSTFFLPYRVSKKWSIVSCLPVTLPTRYFTWHRIAGRI